MIKRGTRLSLSNRNLHKYNINQIVDIKAIVLICRGVLARFNRLVSIVRICGLYIKRLQLIKSNKHKSIVKAIKNIKRNLNKNKRENKER